jgi:acyl-CoA synthetase (AMP-forming)/AMP-acid ligase II
VPINPVLRRAQAAHILADSGAALLLANAGRLDTLEPGDAAGAVVHDEAAVLAALDALAPLPPSAAAPERLAAILYTSGSTGKPKGVMLSHANLWLGAISVAHYLGLAADDRVLAVLPLAFDYGQNQLLSAWAAGACAVPLDYLLPRDVVRAVSRHGITTLAAVPPLWLQLVQARWPDGAGARCAA